MLSAPYVPCLEVDSNEKGMSLSLPGGRLNSFHSIWYDHCVGQGGKAIETVMTCWRTEEFTLRKPNCISKSLVISLG